MSPSQSITLFGTEEPAEAPIVLTAGSLEATLDAGNLRYIKVGGIEALRGVAFLSRNRNWATYSPEISDLKIERTSDGFTVTYEALCRDDEQSFRYSARIEGRADGSLTFEADGEALTDFVTNRTGFVVLHALHGVVGEPLTVEHTDGKIVESRFPALIDPDCPFRDVRALTHEIAPGVKVTCRMEGDAYEMEDHRNWMDASYKTYVRPLALPWPYTIAKGEKAPQRVTLKVEGAPAAAASDGSEVAVSIGPANGKMMPRLGLAVPAENAETALARAETLKAVGAGFLVCHFDPRQGHDAATMQTYGKLGAALDAELVLEAVIPCLDADGNPSADNTILKRDMAAIADAAAGVPFARVAVSPSSDLKCTLPGATFPPAPSWAALFDAARGAFPGAIIGGGMFSYFTELNRKRPPAELLDFICHTGSPIVHAGDDVSVTEALEALPSIFNSVRAFGGGKPYWVFPTAISMRQNPYGAAPLENPDNTRQAMSRVDPRERGLIGAAWYAGYLAHAANTGVDAVTLAATSGPSGVVYTKQPHQQPWFDEAGAAVFPHFHVIAGHAALPGAAVHEATISDPRAVQALAVAGADGMHLWLANLTGAPQAVSLSGVNGAAEGLVLDEANFEAACRDPGWAASAPRTTVNSGKLTLSPYAVAELRFG